MRLLLFITTLLTLASCEKLKDPVAVPVNPEGSPFYFKAYFSGKFKSMQTATDNYFLVPEYSFVEQGSYFRFSGQFAPNGCTTCDHALKILINDSPVITDGVSHIDSLLKEGVRLSFNRKNSSAFKRVVVEYIAENDKLYTSENTIQTSDFLVHYSKAYNTDKKGRKTKLVKASFNCVLISPSDSSSLIIDNAETIFSVAHP
jgi:hypothetical protein